MAREGLGVPDNINSTIMSITRLIQTAHLGRTEILSSRCLAVWDAAYILAAQIGPTVWGAVVSIMQPKAALGRRIRALHC